MVHPRRNPRRNPQQDQYGYDRDQQDQQNPQGQGQNLDNGQVLHQVLTMQTQLMQTMMQAVTAMQQQQQQAPPPPPPPPQNQNRLTEFLRTRPPTLAVTRDPLEADDWLKATEKKLLIAQCTEREKVLFATHQLYGPASDWWDAHSASHPNAEAITWDEFKTSFRAHFVPAGLIRLKKREFHDLKQGNLSVAEYLTRFTQLSRYAPEDVNTDDKKQDLFLNGLHNDIQLQLLNTDYSNFQKLVDKAIIIEGKQTEIERDGKRKLSFTGQQSNANTRPRLMQPSSPFFRGPNTVRPPMPAQRNQFQMQRLNSQFQPQRQNFQIQRPSNPAQRSNPQAPRPATPQAPGAQQNPAAPAAPGAPPRGPCFNCGQNGHFANRCPMKNVNPVTGANQQLLQARNTNQVQQNYAYGRVNHVTTEDAQQAPDVVFGMFLANSNPATVLFDSGASHSFISSRFVATHNLPIATMSHTMLVTSPGGEMKTRHLCPAVSVSIRGVDFLSNLIVLDSPGIDIILGMNWLKKYDRVIHCARQVVQLTCANGTKVEFVAAPSTRTSANVNKIKVIPMEEI